MSAARTGFQPVTWLFALAFALLADAALRWHFKANEKNSEVPAGTHTKSFVIDGQQEL